MTQPVLPMIVQPEALHARLGSPGLVVVDLSSEPGYATAHIPGARHVDASVLTAARPPVMGLLPAEDALAAVLSGAGIRPDTHVVAYDAENGLKASRFLWTLDVIGHERFSLLDGGLPAWTGAGLPVESGGDRAGAAAGDYPVKMGEARRADKAYIMDHLEDPQVVVLDARTPAEYRGLDRRAMRAGHIPGAVNLDWSLAVRGGGDLRLRPADELRELYRAAGVTPDREVIVHCQTHQRSSHTYVVLRSLGYERVRGYPGSWSDWGNDAETPIEG